MGVTDIVGTCGPSVLCCGVVWCVVCIFRCSVCTTRTGPKDAIYTCMYRVGFKTLCWTVFLYTTVVVL